MEINFLADYPIINATVTIVLAVTAINFLVLLFYVLKGRTLADRAIALDAISIQAIAVILLYSMKHGTTLYMSAVLVLAVLGFFGMVVLSKYITRGNIIYPLKRGYRQDDPRRGETGIGSGSKSETAAAADMKRDADKGGDSWMGK